MSQLIAMVATAVMVKGERVVIEPGQPLPELSVHDARELTASGAAKNPGDDAAQDKAARLAARQADAVFESARKRVREEQASTAKPAANPVAKK